MQHVNLRANTVGPQALIPMLMFVIPYFFDWITTAILISKGGREGNPFLQDLSLDHLLILKLLALPSIVVAIFFLSKLSIGYAKTVSYGLYIWFSALTTWNIHLVIA